MRTWFQITQLHKSYGPNCLFDDASLTLLEGQRVGCIGRNGAGKSTLCRILTGEEEADSVHIVRSSQLQMGYLEQQDPYRESETAQEFLVRYTGREPWRCGEAAGRFDIKNERLTRTPIAALSGGYRTRLKLAAMLLREPNFLLLDEPTNYLDLSTLLVLEKWLETFQGGFLVVSHDREFLKRTCDHTLEVDGGGMTLFPGDVETYLEFKEQQREQAERHNRNVEQRRKQLEEFIERFRAKASKAAQARSKMKQLERLTSIEVLHPTRGVRITIPPAQIRRGTALECERLTVGYPDRTVARVDHLAVDRGEKVAVVGDNGQGKTTLLRTLAGQLPALAGKFRWAPDLEIAFYAQHVYASIDPGLDVSSYLRSRAHESISSQQIADMAGCFLFSGADAFKKVGVLSGGERARLCLAGILLSRRPVLVLDEPTNHLDFETVERLALALREYNGTVFFTSHDRTFVHLVTTSVVTVRDGEIRHFPGSYDAYVESVDAWSRSVAEVAGEPEEKHSPKESRRQPVRVGKLQNEALRIEEELKKLEGERTALLSALQGEPYSAARYEELDTLGRRIEGHEARWLELHDQIEALRPPPRE